MRGRPDDQLPLFHVFRVEDRIRPNHPLRDVKTRVDRILKAMSPAFDEAYGDGGRPSVPPECLLKALLLMALYSVRSERQLCERIDTDLLFRWFLDLSASDDVFDATTFTKNRERMKDHRLVETFFDAVVAEALAANLCSEHFSVDGTLIESYASAKSFQPKAEAAPADASSQDAPQPPSDGSSPPLATATPDAAQAATTKSARKSSKGSNGFKPRNVAVDFHGKKRTNETHHSLTDPEALLYRKGRGKEAKLAHMGHTLCENRHGLILAVTTTEASGTAERAATLTMLNDLKATHAVQPKTLGGDTGYECGEFFEEVERRGIEPHMPVKQKPADVETASKKRQPGIRARMRMWARMKDEGYRLSQKCRKKIEEGFGWLKSIAGLGRSRTVGRWKLQQAMEMGAAGYNLLRLRKLRPA